MIIHKAGCAIEAALGLIDTKEERDIMIPHVCDDRGRWGVGSLLDVSRFWKEPEEHYNNLDFYNLGSIHLVRVTNKITVVNMISHMTSSSTLVPFHRDMLYDIDYFKQALVSLNAATQMGDYVLFYPRYGTYGLVGSDWDKIEELIEKNIDTDVYIFDRYKE